MATIEEQLNTIEVEYHEDQDVIALLRKNDAFVDAEEDVLIQRLSWENHLINRFNISQTTENAIAILEQYYPQVKTKFIEAREIFNLGEITEEEYRIASVALITDFETRMINLGVITERLSYERKIETFELTLAEEKLYVPESGIIDAITFGKLCVSQDKITIDYLNDLKELNVLV